MTVVMGKQGRYCMRELGETGEYGALEFLVMVRWHATWLKLPIYRIKILGNLF